MIGVRIILGHGAHWNGENTLKSPLLPRVGTSINRMVIMADHYYCQPRLQETDFCCTYCVVCTEFTEFSSTVLGFVSLTWLNLGLTLFTLAMCWIWDAELDWLRLTGASFGQVCS